MKRKATSQRSGSSKRARKGYGLRAISSAYASNINRKPRQTLVSLTKQQAFPPNLDVNLTYFQQINLTATTPGLAVHYLFRTNSIFDPDFSGVGHQPGMHDQLALIYEHYRVLRSKIEIVATSPGGTGGQAMIGIRRAAVNTTPPTDPELIMEQPDVTSRMLTNSLASVKLRKYWNLKTVAKAADADQYNAAFGANPLQVDYFDIFNFNPDPTVTGSKIPIMVKITYTVRCYDLLPQGKS